MPNRSADTAVYAENVAKIEIDIPDDLLRRVDKYLERSGETRDQFLRRLAEAEMTADHAGRTKEFEELLGPPLHLGGDSAQKIKESREDDDPWR
jgi:hypothetical protein